MRIAIIGADPWFAEALRGMIAQTGDHDLLLVEPSERAFVEHPRSREAELAILSLDGVEPTGTRLVGWAKRHSPALRIVLKLPTIRADLVRNAIQSGTWGCFAADEPPETLLSLLASVAAGRVSFPYVDFATLRDDPFESLTRREAEVLRALAKGWTNAQISSRLGISANTVKYHLKLIYDKLGVSNRATAVAQYLNRHQG